MTKRLTRNEVLNIRAMARLGFTQADIAVHLGIHRNTVRNVVSWRTHRRAVDAPRRQPTAEIRPGDND